MSKIDTQKKATNAAHKYRGISYPLAMSSDGLADLWIVQNDTLSIYDVDQFFSSECCLR